MVDLALVGHDLGAADVGVLGADLEQLGADQLVDLALVAEDAAQTGDLRDQLGVLGADLALAHAREALQAQVEDGLGLDLGEVERLHQPGAGGVRVGARADELDDRVEVVQRDEEALEDVRPLLRLLQQVLASGG